MSEKQNKNMLDGQDTVSESETQDDTQAWNDATEDLAEAKISAEADYPEMPSGDRAGNDFCGCLRSITDPGVYELDGSSRIFQAIEGGWWIFAGKQLQP